MKTPAIVVASLLTATPVATHPVLAQSVGEQTGVNSALGLAPSTQDFVTQAAISDMYEIETSEAALSAQIDPKTQDFAKQMIEAHRKTSDELKALVTAGVKATPPTEMDGSHADEVGDLKQKKGGDFADDYAEDQVDAHETAVSLFQRYADGGEDPKLKEWAGKTLPELKRHLEMARALGQ
jgi:putative membrane protein